MSSNVISLSGGKDSTALLLRMLELGESIADVVFFDTGWEFPELYEHLEQIEKYTGITITRLRPRIPSAYQTDKAPFDFMFSELPVHKRGTNVVRMIGRGWAAPRRRWCTGRKQEALKCHINSLTYSQGATLPLVQCIGIAADEALRAEDKDISTDYLRTRFPLIEWGWTEQDALQFCIDRGFTWGGLYSHFKRLSCFCCPLQPRSELRKLYTLFPGLWQRMLEMESWLPEGNCGRRFRDNHTVSDFTVRFKEEAEAERG